MLMQISHDLPWFFYALETGVASLSVAVFARHVFRVIHEIKDMSAEKAIRLADGVIAMPGAYQNRYLKRPCREKLFGILR